MANLSNLIHELRERIAASSSSSSISGAGEDPLETKFRTVLPNLLLAYVLPSSTANEREVTAVLKLLSHTARNFPGVFFHGRSAAVLPAFGRILPFLAEPAFRVRHGIIFDTISSLLTLLRSGDREAYRQVFLDAMVAVEDVSCIALLYKKKSAPVPLNKVSVKCFCESFSLISDAPVLFGELLASCRPPDGPGVLVDLTSEVRWQHFAAWLVKLVCRFLTEGTLYVEGLVSTSFVYKACSFLCYGDATLHMACFDFARIVATVIDVDVVPVEEIIKSISCISEQDDKEVSIFRDTAYDSALGTCLHALLSACQDDVVENIAGEIAKIFPVSIQRTQSSELQVAMCSAYLRIAKICPTHIWRPGIILSLLCSPTPCLPLINCIRMVIDVCCGCLADKDVDVGRNMLESTKKLVLPKAGQKRSVESNDDYHRKRQKIEENKLLQRSNILFGNGTAGLLSCKLDEEYALELQKSLLKFVGLLKPECCRTVSLKPATALRALSMLCLAYYDYPEMGLSVNIFQQVLSWIPWICKQAKEEDFLEFDISIYLEAVHSVLLLQGFLLTRMKLFQDDDYLNDTTSFNCEIVKHADLVELLKLAWKNPCFVSQDHTLWKLKCLCIQVLSKISMKKSIDSILEVFDLAILDEAEVVKAEALISMPVIVLYSGHLPLASMWNRLKSMGSNRGDQVCKSVLLSLGYLSCLHHSIEPSYAVDGSCKLFFGDSYEIHINTLDILLRGFWCPQCDNSVVHNQEQWRSVSMPHLPTGSPNVDFDFIYLHHIFFQLISVELSEELQTVGVQVMSRILRHSARDVLLKTRLQWIEYIDFCLLHKTRAMREAFSSEISCFLQNHILDCLFMDEEGTCNTKEHGIFDRIKHALAGAEDPQVFETLLESMAEVMSVIGSHNQLFVGGLILFVDQLDNPNLIVRITASRLIKKSCFVNRKGGFELIFSKSFHIRDVLFDHLCLRLVSRPAMVKEFAEAVVGVRVEELIGKMVPFVIPKLVVSQKHNHQAVIILHELANYLNTDLVPLVVNWLPKVLAFALFHADGQELSSVLHFYQVETGSDNREIFSAALPQLLDELLCFTGEGDMDEIDKRTIRVPKMIQDVATILTGSDDLPGFLKNHFVGLLNSIDRKMLHADDLLIQKQALKRIEKLIEMMGSYLSTYVPKIMVLLMYAIDKEALQTDGLNVLHFFIKQLAKLSPSSTKHVISQVVAAFIPSLERCMEMPSLHLKKMVEVLEDLILENKLVLKQQIRELPLLPSVPEVSEVNKVIQEVRGSMTLRDQLRDAIDGLNHESLNVRYMVACELSKLLNIKREDVMVLISGESLTDLDVISSLITSLLRGCAEESRTAVGQRLKLVCADCLGALGAVDPAKFKGISSERFKIACSDDDLIFELIHKHLARAFRAASDTIVQDSAALAIQELLKLAGCQESLSGSIQEHVEIDNSEGSNESTARKRGQRLWDRFSNYVKDIIAPCLTSRFQLPSATDTTSPGPIYRPTMSFRRWIFFWIRKLTAHATGSRSGIFSACRGIVRHDMQTALYLLPYLVLNAVCHGTHEARNGINEEILTVLDAEASENSAAAVHGITGGQSEVCVQAVFTLLDNLGQWVDDLKQEIALSQSMCASGSKQTAKLKSGSNPHVDSQDLLVQCSNVSGLLSAIPKVTLAKSSFRCQAHARALMYFESHVREKSGSFNPAAENSGIFADEDISFLLEIYSGLDEPDGLSGFANLRKSSNLQDHFVINEKVGNWAEVLTSCEQALQMEPQSVQRHADVLKSLLNMCHLQAMVTHVDGLICRIPQYKKTWSMQGVQAAWRLGRWDLMEEYLSVADKEGLICSNIESNASFDLGLAKIIQAMMKKDQFLVAERIAQAKQALLAPLAAAGMDSYMRAYPFVVKLHMIRELEDFHALLGDESFLEKQFCEDLPGYSKLIKDWDSRLRFTQPSLWAREPLLAFRRLVFTASNMGAQVGNCWLQYAKLCRSAGHYETANRAVLEAQASGAPNVHIEKAKLLWSTRKCDSALSELQQLLLNMPAEVLGSAAISSLTSLSLILPNPLTFSTTQASKENHNVAKTILLYTRWIHCTGQKQKEDIINLYSRVRELQPKWEKGYFFMAKYCDDLLVDARKRQEDTLMGMRSGQGMMSSSSVSNQSLSSNTEEKPWWSYLPDVLLFYAKGLHRGHKDLFQALPRLLTLWFEFGSWYLRDGLSSNKSLKTVHTRVLSIMRGCLKDLPTYQWLTVLSQLISRICHQNEDIVRIVKHIITSVLQEYPQQALWMMAAVSKSTVAARREAAAEIIQAARKGIRRGKDNSSLFTQFASLIDHLIKLCFHPGQPKARIINILTEFSALKRMMPLGIIMPLQQALTVTLPSYDASASDPPDVNVFSDSDHVTIIGIADEAEVLSSLQRPKKVVFLGSDGAHHPFLCKPKDDLRKDARMMEFTAMINRLLSKFPESRRRKLYIRTFAVIPLTEDCGMVEWVPHTRGLRQILQDIYVADGKFDRQKTHPLVKRIYDQCSGKMPEDEMLKSKILPMFPPVFHKWFLITFSEPAAWFRARVAYAHTSAVWSMVGHIVGLGDRHGENILFDSTTGDTVHVDFSCLFDKGLQLEKPELVPFRLTQNMIDGLGITGYEGVFLKVCEITLSVLRAHKETLMSVLETFIHDPLVEWTKSHKSSGVEVQNPHAQRAISNIKARLQGVVVGVGAAPSLPLAVEGQARRLIAEAVSHKNLGKMYIWWMAWF
ncbi:serine/threonine-protein kinase ATR isoform X2 [Dioscorea cayenensis subsp. rotundata]|uniref:Serine/threonine-protein kinase ATR n=1 Tax=Dioscorea cayennensis subsp. rotundata TaxID=55577 RepID=A0AB40C8B9_DIOCR|nr:serine/threonine-protein kinase ATR isoform X2 [Dioscorea cayenensis subsp. rotundata]